MTKGTGVTLFHSDEFGHTLPGPRPERTPAQRKRSTGMGILIGSLILTVALAAVPSGYVIEQPGPTSTPWAPLASTTQ